MSSEKLARELETGSSRVADAVVARDLARRMEADVLILKADARHLPLPDVSVDCVITSPPYWGLRDYGVQGQLGMERTWQEYVANLRACAREIWRVLKPAGSFWLNLGDCFISNSDGCSRGETRVLGLQPRVRHGPPWMQRFPSKMKLGLPWRVRFALNEDGWISRNDVVWSKTNAMPVPAKDRLACRHEYLFHFVKQRYYHFNLESIRSPVRPGTVERCRRLLRSRGAPRARGPPIRVEHPDVAPLAARYKHDRERLNARASGNRVWVDPTAMTRMMDRGRNPGDVWALPAAGFRGHHAAVFPEALVEVPLKATCPPGGVVLDPFAGSGTVGVVALRLGRRAILSDLTYQNVQRQRIRKVFEELHSARSSSR
jgi:site-specific DNA-methyltransferase (cytosine-N4-specific)